MDLTFIRSTNTFLASYQNFCLSPSGHILSSAESLQMTLEVNLALIYEETRHQITIHASKSNPWNFVFIHDPRTHTHAHAHVHAHAHTHRGMRVGWLVGWLVGWIYESCQILLD